jgi:hypothetical protein
MDLLEGVRRSRASTCLLSVPAECLLSGGGVVGLIPTRIE